MRKRPRKRRRSPRSASRHSPRLGPTASSAGRSQRRKRLLPGWVGSKALSSTFDDWEPAVAADPKAPYVYLLTTRYAERACGVHCPTPWIPLKVSKDGGTTWSPQAPLCQCDRSKARVRSDHRGRAEDRRGLRGLPELRPAQRLVDGIHEIHRPWPDLDQAGPRLRQRLLDGQARDHVEPLREACLFLMERAERRRPLRRHLA